MRNNVITIDAPTYKMFVLLGLALIGDLREDSNLSHPYPGIYGYLGGERAVAVNVTRIDATVQEHQRGQESTVWNTPLGVSATLRTPARLTYDAIALLNFTFSIPEAWQQVAAELPGAVLSLPAAVANGNAIAMPPAS